MSNTSTTSRGLGVIRTFNPHYQRIVPASMNEPEPIETKTIHITAAEKAEMDRLQEVKCNPP